MSQEIKRAILPLRRGIQSPDTVYDADGLLILDLTTAELNETERENLASLVDAYNELMWLAPAEPHGETT